MPASGSSLEPQSVRNLTLLVPGLLGAAGAEPANPRQPATLHRLLARADCLPQPGDDLEARLFDLFGVAVEPGRDLPVAAVTRVADMGVVDNEWWIRADPVYLEPHRDSLVLHVGLGLTQAEAGRMAGDLNESLALDGWALKAPRPERWYLKPPGEATVTTTPLARAVGRDVHPLLPQGPDHRAWRTRLNELQILLHTATANAERETRGQMPANSVWFWGGGRLPPAGVAEWATVWAADPLSLGLARLADIPAQSVPGEGEDCLSHAWQGQGLVVLDPVSGPESLAGMSRAWVEPLLAGVHQRRLSSLTVVSDSGPRFHYARHCRWRLWRRPRPLPAWRVAV